jgi:hypothetical protein
MKSLIPDDENGAVLMRMRDGGDSLEKARIIDFCFAFAERSQALEFAAAVPEVEYEVCISRYEERQMWQAIVKKFMKPEHAEISRIEADLSMRAAVAGGEADGWGCMRIEDLKKEPNQSPEPTAPSGRGSS